MENTPDLVARSPEDLLACVPLSLGFVPQESVVMLGLGPAAVPHARIDLGRPEDLPAVCAALVGPAVAHGADRVALSLWTDLDRAAGPAEALRRAFAQVGIDVVVVLAYDGRAWTEADPSASRPPTPFDVLCHHFVTEAVVRGRVVHRSRSDLADSLQPVPERVVATSRALLRLEAPDAARVRETVCTLVGDGAAPDAQQVASLLTAAARPDLRDGLWSTVPRAEARLHVDLWIAVLRATPPALAAAPAAVLGALAWRAGDGALAWCALDAARRSGVPCSLASLVADLLASAVSPDDLLPEDGDPRTGGAA